MLKRKFPEPEASGSPRAKRTRQLDRDRESLQQRGHRVARSQVDGIPSAWRLQVFDRESLVEPGTQIVCVEERGSGWGVSYDTFVSEHPVLSAAFDCARLCALDGRLPVIIILLISCL